MLLPRPEANHLRLVARDESGPWGQASTQIVHMVFDDQAVALITSAEGDSAHLAEQVGNKIGVPILTLSTDSTTTEINLPWIFRMGPTDAMQAQAFARDIYQKRKLQRVVLLNQNDRDGRLGAEAFIKAAGEANAPAPLQLTMDPKKITGATAAEDLATAQAVVIWSDAADRQSACGARTRCAAHRPTLPVPQGNGRRFEHRKPRALPFVWQPGCRSVDRRRPRKPASSRGILSTLSPALRRGAQASAPPKPMTPCAFSPRHSANPDPTAPACAMHWPAFPPSPERLE